MFVPVLLFFKFVHEGLIMPKCFFPHVFRVKDSSHTSCITESSAGETRDCCFTHAVQLKEKPLTQTENGWQTRPKVAVFLLKGGKLLTHPPSTYGQECFTSKRAQLRQLLSMAHLRSPFFLVSNVQTKDFKHLLPWFYIYVTTPVTRPHVLFCLCHLLRAHVM